MNFVRSRYDRGTEKPVRFTAFGSILIKYCINGASIGTASSGRVSEVAAIRGVRWEVKLYIYTRTGTQHPTK